MILPLNNFFFCFQLPTKPQLSEDLLLSRDNESLPSRATDVPSTLKDSGYGDVANESSRNETPDDSYLKPKSLLKTITDDLEEDQISDRPKSAVRLVDRPELINTDLPSDFMASR